MRLGEIDVLRRQNLSRLSGKLYPILVASKEAAISYANDESSDVRQACLSMLILDYQIDNATVGCLRLRTKDTDPMVRSTARLGLVRHFRGLGIAGWELPLTEVILDDQLREAERLAAYADLLRFIVDPPESFDAFSRRLESATLSDVDWQFVEQLHTSVK